MPPLLRFVLQSISAGLALAFLVLLVQPTWRERLLGSADGQAVQAEAAHPGSFAGAVDAAAPAVVNVFTAKRVVDRPSPLLEDPLLRRLFGDRLPAPRERLETSLGSGVIVAAGGYVLTNHHVIRGADTIQVALRDGRTTPAVVIGTDPETDLAVLQVALADLPLIRIGRSQSLRVGDVVLAIGNPFGVGQTVTHGIVSAVNRNRVGINAFEDFIQTDAAINPGNSGGALVNSRGELVGINTAIISRSGGAQGIGFAIPVSTAHEVLKELLANGSVTRGWLGIEAEDLTPELLETLALDRAEGVLVRAVLVDGPADLAGVEPGDLLVGIGGQPVRDSRSVMETIAGLPPGERVRLELLRGGERLALEALVSRRPALNED